MNSIYKLIKLNRLVTSHRVKFASVLLAHHLKLRHLFVRFDPLMACNLRCTMCYFSNDDYRSQIKGVFTETEVERIAQLFFPKTVQLVIGCGTEPTLYKNFPELVRIGKQYRVPYVGFTTNAQLLTPEHCELFIKHRLDELTISVHGVRKETYEHFMHRSSFNTLHTVLQTLDEIKRVNKSALPYLRVNYTVNADNLVELTDFFKIFGLYNIKTLQIRPIIDFGGTYNTLLQPEHVEPYNSIIRTLGEECKRRNITYLANIVDPLNKQINYSSVILQAVRRHITPQVVWQPDFDWRNESYDDYCKRIGLNKHLLHLITSNIDEVRKYNAGHWGNHSVKYDVL